MDENKITFYQYANVYKTQIPIIQRDYAQGREGKKEKAILTRFLLDIARSLEKDEPLSLNFIYGLVYRIDEKKGVFLPIDGQQRLTTLFLLHWFVALRTKHLDKLFKKTEKFSYQTRSSAIEFFESIQPSSCADKQEERINELYDIQSGSDIKYFPWFKLDWSYDQTIAGVINALDMMFRLFNSFDLNTWWEKLTSDQRCKITFLFIAINEKGSNDVKPFENESKAATAYIKMNARGKHLSDFENAKALIHSLDNKEGIIFVSSFDNEYIKYIEKIAGESKKAKEDIGILSRIIDDMMMRLLINLFNDLRYIFNELLSKKLLSKNIEYTYLIYMDALRDFHDNSDNEKDIFYSRYFSILNRLFRSEIIDSDEFVGYVSSNRRSKRLDFCLLFSYYYYNGYNNQGIKEWKYLLKNFHYDDSKNTQELKHYYKILSSLNAFSKDIEKVNDSRSPLIYMSKNQKRPEFLKIPSVEPGDWKEEHIKSKILCEKRLDFDYFNSIEENFDRKIRAFLYMAGFWNSSGDMTKLDSYTNLAIVLELRSDEIPMEIKKMYYLFATGFNETPKSKFSPSVDKTIYSWKKTDDAVQERLDILSKVFDYLIGNSKNSCELINAEVSEKAKKLYEEGDWRSFALARERGELFFHLDGENLQISDDESINIFSYVKQLDLDGEPIKECIHFQQNYIFGLNVQKIGKTRYIKYEYGFDANIRLKGEHASGYVFSTNNDTLFKIYRYIGYQGSERQFEALGFDIARYLEEYIKFAEKIKEKLLSLSQKEINEFVSDINDPRLKGYIKRICGENTKYRVSCYNNVITTIFCIDITIDLNDPNIKRETETLSLY